MSPARRGKLADAAEILALSNFAIAQPLYEVLAKSPGFFAAHGTGRAGVLAVAALASLGLPAALGGAELAVGLAGERARRAFHAASLLGLSALLALPLVGKAFDGTVPAFALALSLGVLFVVALGRLGGLRSALVLLGPLSLVFPAWFVWRMASGSDLDAGPGFAGGAPVVLIVFDELPTAALLDGDRRIDRARHPHFAALADRSTWFRNATAVAQDTKSGLPAILTGRYPRRALAPVAKSHRENLFRVLAGAYRIHAWEPTSEICPRRLCERPFHPDLRGLLADVGWIYLHVVLPADARSRLPSLEGRVAGFAEVGSETEGGPYTGIRRLEGAREFVRSIGPERDAFHFLHLLLPHTPYQFRASGEPYSRFGGIPGKQRLWSVWGPEPEPVDRARQRFLLQLLLTDRILGEIVARLEEVGLFDEALVVVTADHGTSFRPGVHRRALGPDNYRDILYVPLLVKRPGQRRGEISDANVEAIDVLPTIAEIVGAPLPPGTEGRSVFAATAGGRSTKRALAAGPGYIELREYPAEGGGEFAELPDLMAGLRFDAEREFLHLGSGSAELVGRRVAEIADRLAPPPSGLPRGYRPTRESRTESLAELAAGWIRGEVPAAEPGGEARSLDLAIAVDGEVAAVGRTFPHGDAEHYFAELLPRPAAPLRPEQVQVRVISPGIAPAE